VIEALLQYLLLPPANIHNSSVYCHFRSHCPLLVCSREHPAVKTIHHHCPH